MTRRRGADSGKSNHTCSIQDALDTRVTAEAQDIYKTGTEDVIPGVELQRGSIQSSLHEYTFAFSSSVRTHARSARRVAVKGNYSRSMIKKEAVVGVCGPITTHW